MVSYTSADWASINPVLVLGQLGYDITTQEYKIGNGASTWANLPYFVYGGIWGEIIGTLSNQTDLNTALGLLAPKTSPTFSGTATIPTISGTTGTFTGLVSTPNLLEGLSSTATAGATTTLTVSSNYTQMFTGTTTQTVQLPVVSTLVLGQQYLICNRSTGAVTVQSSGLNTIGSALSAGTNGLYTCILLTGTTAASWDVHAY